RARGTENADRQKTLVAHLKDQAIAGTIVEDPYVNILHFLRAATTGSHARGGALIVPPADGNLRLIAKLSNDYPPLYLYIDNQDDSFADHPAVWRSCGLGTFRALRTIRAKTDGRAHCCMALRSEV